MSQRPSEEEQVKFRDVAICFSEEEWKNLRQWQKDFYQNVMKEIHQALFLMGYQIVHPENLLQIYKGRDAYVQVSQDTEKTDVLEPGVSSHQEVMPDIKFRISKKEESDCEEQRSSEDTGGSNSASSCFPIVTAAFSLTTEQELQLYPLHQQDVKRRETSYRPSSRVAVCLEKEATAVLIGSPGAGEESCAQLSSGPKALSAVVSADIHEESEVCFIDQLDCEIIRVTGPTGEESMNGQKKVPAYLTCSKAEAGEEAVLRSEPPNMLQNSCEGSRSHLWSEHYIEIRGGRMTPFERDKNHTDYIREYQETAKVQISPEDNECDPCTPKVLDRLLFQTKNQAAHGPTQYNQSNSPRNQCTSKSAKRPRVRAFPCLECEKSFFDKTQLIYHNRIHTGERPHACSLCDKRYNRSHHLKEHIRTHTGEKPYTCLVCQRKFTYKSHFNLHRRTKH